MVTAADRTSFMISNLELKGGVVLFPRMFFNWDISSAEDIRAHHFDIIDVIKPMPSSLDLRGYIVIGTGPQFVQLDSSAITKLKSFGIKFDILDTVSLGDLVSSSQHLQREL